MSESASYLKELAERFSLFMHHINKSRKELAKELGRSEAMVGNYATGNNMIPVEILIHLVEKYNLNTNWLYTGEKEMILQDSNRVNEPNEKYFRTLEKYNQTLEEQLSQCRLERDALRIKVEELTHKLNNGKNE